MGSTLSSPRDWAVSRTAEKGQGLLLVSHQNELAKTTLLQILYTMMTEGSDGQVPFWSSVDDHTRGLYQPRNIS